MFTGLVEGQGIVQAVAPDGAAVRLDIEMPPVFDDIHIGDSIAISGCCLTVVELRGSVAAFQAGQETLSKTSLSRLTAGSRVNLERSVPAAGRMGGHFMQGHVDGVAGIAAMDRDGEWVTMWFRVPRPLMIYLVPKGSVAVDGVSLTVVNVDDDRFSVALIPHTLEVTTLGQRVVGDIVNIETDIIGRYVERLLAARLGNQSGDITA